MPVTGSCHCGAVRIAVPAAPEWLASCNCSICTKTGTLMAYYPDDGSVRVDGATATYIWGDRMIAHHHCPLCACKTHWKLLAEDVRGTSEQAAPGTSYGRIGVNARLLDGFAVTKAGPTFDGRAVEVRFMDNAG